MKKTLITLFIFMALVLPAQAGNKTMSLQIKKGSLRTTPSFLGKVVATVNYGARLVVDKTEGDWSYVFSENGKASGWIHSSALTRKKIKLNASDQGKVAASSGELALAGKGFNSDVEAEFKSKNKDVDFSWIDKMEKIKVPYSKMQEFLKAGGITPERGAR